MEGKKREVIRVLAELGRPIRLPTAQWLFSDLLGLLDIEVRDLLGELKEANKVMIDNGGWIRLTYAGDKPTNEANSSSSTQRRVQSWA